MSDGKGKAKADDGAKTKESLEDQDRREVAQEVVSWLHEQYTRIHERRTDYVNLFSFICFGILWLLILGLQRDTTAAYEVQNTLNTHLLPEDTTFDNMEGVYSWAQDTVSKIWVNPVCGDGLCEEPWEFPQYADFGCRADCGDLPSRFNLTTLQLDLEWDFTHIAGSDSLRARAQWNLCPASGGEEKPPHGTGCYYESDRKFESLSGDCFGEQCPEPLLLYDVPAGTKDRPTRWEIRVKGDIFHKVSGSVLSYDNVTADADVIKTDIAIASSRNTTDTDAAILREAAKLADMAPSGVVNYYKSKELDAKLATINGDLDKAQSDMKTEQGKAEPNATKVSEFNAEVDRLKALVTEANTNHTGEVNALLACDHNVLKASTNTESAKRRQDEPGGRSECQKVLDKFFEDQLKDARTMIEERGTVSDASGKELMNKLVEDVKLDNKNIYKTIKRATGLLASDSKTASMETLFNEYVRRNYAAAPDAGHAARLVPAVLSSMDLVTMSTASKARAAELEQRAAFEVSIPKRQIEYKGWEGSVEAYMTCNVAARAPEYLGECMTDADVEKLNFPKKDDDVMMEVYTRSCNEVCDCTAPKLINPASADDGYGPVRPSCTSGPGPNRTCICKECLPDGVTMPARLRRLLQEDSYAQLGDSLTRLSSKQGDLSGSVDTLKEQLGKSFAARAASQKSMSNSLKDTMSSGFDELKVGQSEITKKLDAIIGQQEKALAAAQRAASLAEQNNQMIQRRGDQQQLVNRAVTLQLQQIEDAALAGVISEEQRRELLVGAEVNRIVQLKKATMSNIPCSEATMRHAFEISTKDGISYPTQLNSTRFRMVGLTNRVVAGMMVHATRKGMADCGDARFDKIDENCRGARTVEPYGIDPVFRASSALYDPDLDNSEGVAKFYNCTELLDKPTLYCREYFNRNNVPYGFFHRKMTGYPDGFFVWFDINLNEENAQRYLLTMQEGLFLDTQTDEVRAQTVIYNAELQVFGNVQIYFRSSESGQVDVLHSTKVIDVELYVTDLDNFRLFLEVLLGIALIFGIVNEGLDLLRMKKKFGRYSAYFQSIWNYIDVLNLALMTMGYITWWTYAFLAEDFRCKINYDIYADLEAEARIMKINGNGQGLDSLASMYSSISELTERLAFYYAIAGVNIMLYLLRVLKLMHFQPRLGVVTRTLTLAAADLFHFFVLFFIIFFGYAIMGYLVFGNAIETFSTVPDAIMTCFEFLLGEIGVNGELKELQKPWHYISGQVFFWSYAILVQQILLNFVLAIIVDAYSEVKEQSQETVGILTEISEIFSDTWKKNLKRIGLYKSYVPNHRVRLLLEAWVKGMSLEELEEEHRKEAEEEFVEKPRVLKVGETELEKEELATLLRGKLGDEMMRAVMPNEDPDEVANLVAETIVDSYGQQDDDEEDGDDDAENQETKADDLEALAKQVLEEQEQLARLQNSILKQQHSILVAFGTPEDDVVNKNKV